MKSCNVRCVSITPNNQSSKPINVFGAYYRGVIRPDFLMIGLEINDALVVKQQEILEKALSTDPKTQKVLQKLIRQVILEARAQVVQKFPYNDPRHSARSVRSSVYKQILGANLNIYPSMKSTDHSDFEPPRTLQPGQRGGNRRVRSERTKTMLKYGPYARSFVLRWLNEGTTQRAIKKLTEIKRPKSSSKFVWKSDPSSYGNRGSIQASHWFKQIGEEVLIGAVDNLAILIDEELDKIMNNKN